MLGVIKSSSSYTSSADWTLLFAIATSLFSGISLGGDAVNRFAIGSSTKQAELTKIYST